MYFSIDVNDKLSPLDILSYAMEQESGQFADTLGDNEAKMIRVKLYLIMSP